METSVDVLLVGGGVASVRCARTLRREGFDGSILIVGTEQLAPYNRPPLSKELLRDDLPDDLVAAEAPSWYERRGVELLTGVPVIGLDPDARVAMLGDGRRVRFERCLLATGAEPILPPVPGAERGLLLRTLADSRRLRSAALALEQGAPVVVVGAGFIGIEVASALAGLGLRPTIVERTHAPWAGSLGRDLSHWAAERLAGAGVALRLGAAVTRLEDGAVATEGELLPSALSVIGVGVRPRVALAERAGLRLDDGIVVDAAQRTSHPAIWAAGDVARADGLRLEHWHAAREAGERAARSMLGLTVPAPRVPWVFSEVAGVALDVFGAADGWDEERWVRPASVLACLARGRVVQLASIGSALEPDLARELVAQRVTVGVLEGSIPDS